jgi:hypothetical protein
MTLPTLLLALLISTLCGALYYFVRGGSGWRLFLYCGAGTLGFALGQWVSVWQGWSLYRFGSLEIGIGILGSFLFLALSEWLVRIEVKQESSV